MTTLFISDLHLDADRPALTKLFQHFVDHYCDRIDALYIVGDLFEAWLGDDDSNAFIESVKTAIRKIVAREVPVYMMTGNRDFLMGQQFCQETGMTLLLDPTVIELYGTPTLLMHGDTLCTQDVVYQRKQKRYRHPLMKKFFYALPLTVRQKLANHLRGKSKKTKKVLTAEIMDVDEHTVEQVMAEHGIKQLIHGHTHRPDAHHYTDGRVRYVLSDWHEKGQMLVCEPDGRIQSQYFDLETCYN